MTRQQQFLLAFTLAVTACFNAGFFPGDPPTGRTGAPGELTCQSAGCHAGGSFTGAVALSGLPDTVLAGQTYPITLTQTSNAVVAGFQLTALDDNNMRAGTLQAGSGSNVASGVGGRQYVRQSDPKNLNQGSTSWTFNWQAPNSAAGNRIAFYFSSLAANGNGNNSGDNVLLNSKPVTLTPLVSIADPEKDSWVRLYPTLATDQFQVELSPETPAGYLRLFDLQGKLVLELNLTGMNTVPVNSLPKGAYLAQIEAGRRQKVLRVVVF